MLYLEKFKSFKIILRGIPVEQFNIADELRYSKIVKYKPYKATMEQVIQTGLALFFSFSTLWFCYRELWLIVLLFSIAYNVFSYVHIKPIFLV